MILAAGIGYALQRLFSWPSATALGVLVGALVAPLVPSKSGCGIRRPSPEA